MSETLAEVCHWIGMQHHKSNDYTGAEHWYNLSLAEHPMTKVHEGMMYALISQRKHAAALPHCTLAMHDDDPHKKVMAQFTRGLTYLNVGDYPSGFADMEIRLKVPALADVPYRHKIEGKALWDGKPCDHLIVYAEQGFGDVIMFSRFLPQIIERGLAKKVTLEVHESIVPLMQYNFPMINVVPHKQEVIPHDAFTLMVSLCHILGTTIDTLPYRQLEAEPSAIDKWKRISQLKGLKVGLCWAGREAQDVHTAIWNSQRQIQLKALAPILFNSNISFVSLQRGVFAPADFPVIHEFNIDNWSDTAAIIHHLDMVITIDSGPVHLAGALGKCTLLMNHVDTCWRWGKEKDKSPWYDSVTILRQKKEADWSAPIADVTRIVNDLVAQL